VALIEETLLLIERHAGALGKVRLERVFPGGKLRARVDRDAMKQVFWNLCNNALRAMPDGGVAHGRSGNGRRLRADFDSRHRNWFRPARDSPNFSSRFSPDSPGGTGLGLAIVYQILQAHKGHIRVETEPRSWHGVRRKNGPSGLRWVNSVGRRGGTPCQDPVGLHTNVPLSAEESGTRWRDPSRAPANPDLETADSLSFAAGDENPTIPGVANRNPHGVCDRFQTDREHTAVRAWRAGRCCKDSRRPVSSRHGPPGHEVSTREDALEAHLARAPAWRSIRSSVSSISATTSSSANA